MRSWSHALIGLLVGVIIMQWAMPVARSQPDAEHLTVASLTLVNADGEVVVQMATQDNGSPFLTMGRGASHVSLVADEADTRIAASNGDAWFYGQARPDGAHLWLTADVNATPVDQAYAGATLQDGGLVFVVIDGETHRFPSPQDTATKPSSWGEMKSRIDRIDAGTR